MRTAIAEIQIALAAALSAMPDVFSTPQWGGRAYKLPGPGSRGKRKPALLAHVWIDEHVEPSIGVSFKLQPARAKAMTRRHRWLSPHSFRTLAPSGWVTAEIRTKSQCATLIRLLCESRAMHPVHDELKRGATARRGKSDSNAHDKAAAHRIDALLRRKREEGWSPPHDAEFDR